MWFYNGDHNNVQIIEQCRANNPESIYINTDTEWFWNIEKHHVDAIYATGVKNIYIIFSSYYDDFYSRYYEPRGIPVKNLIFWPTFWFNWAEKLCLGNKNQYQLQSYTSFTYPFISLNNKPHDHRCAMIDMFTKYNLLDAGIVTWNKTPYPNISYQFKYYDNNFRGLDDDFVTKLDSFLIPKQYHESFLHVVAEATTEVPFITEKTVLPILYKKPFITLGNKSFNTYLKQLGFELFDEIIDYSYDSIDNVEERAEKMVKNILPLLNKNLYDLYIKLQPKLEHNYNRALEIIHDINFIPSIIIDRYNWIKSQNMVSNGVDGRYQNFIEQIVKTK
jgi:hypothetical protein